MPSSETLGDAVRTLGLIAGSGTVGMALLTVVLYVIRYARDWHVARIQGAALDWRGLLPLHVILIGLSHSVLTIVAMSVHYEHLSEPIRWEACAMSGAMTLSAVALWQMLRYQRRVYPRRPADVPPLEPRGEQLRGDDI